MAASAVIAAVGLALAIGMAVKGASDQNKAKEIASSNIRPTYKISEEEQTNQKLSELIAGRGLDQNTKQFYTQNAERGLTSGIDAILKGGGNADNVGQLYGMYTDSLGRLALADDQERMANLHSYMDQNRRMSEEKDKVFQVDQYAPYADRAKEAATLNAQGGQWISQGISTGYGAVSGFAGSAGQRRDVSRMNNGVDNSSQTPTLQIANDAPQTQASNYSNNAYNFKNLTPEQQATIGSLYWRGY